MSKRALAALSFALLLGACERSAERVALDEQEIETTLAEFLPMLAEAYGSGGIESLRPYAAEKELARVEKLVADLADQGRYLAPELLQLEVEESHIWNNSNAFVTTHEVWDVRMYALGTSEVLAEDLEKSYRVKYQLKRDADRWRVLFRTIQD